MKSKRVDGAANSRTAKAQPSRASAIGSANTSDFTRGFVCAIACGLNGHGDSQMLRDMLRGIGSATALKHADEQDIETLRKHGYLPNVPDQRPPTDDVGLAEGAIGGSLHPVVGRASNLQKSEWTHNLEMSDEAVGSQCAPVQAASVRPSNAADEGLTSPKLERVPRSDHRTGITGHQGARLHRSSLQNASTPNESSSPTAADGSGGAERKH